MSLTGEKKNISKSNIRSFWARGVGRAAKRYLVVGGVSALADWTIFSVMFYGLGLHYIAAGMISFILATGLNYYLSVRFVFGAGSRGPSQAMFLVYVVSILGLVLNLGALTIGIDVLEQHPLVSKIFATAVSVFWNFLARYFYIFK